MRSVKAIFLAAGLMWSTVVVSEKGPIHREAQLSELATKNDWSRLRKWKEALKEGREAAIAGGHARAIASRAPLFDGDAALPDGRIPPGLYHCSVTKLDGKPAGGLPYIAYPAFLCRVVKAAGRLHFTKLTGSQLTAGWIHDVSSFEGIYLGSAFYGYEDAAVPYGSDVKRDDAAIVQRIGEKRWRMLFPYPYYESIVDVMELTPAR